MSGDEELAAARMRLVMSLTPETIGRRIADARREKGWSQPDLAVVMGVAPGTIYRWERGKLPAVELLIRLARKLEKSEDYFLETPQRQDELRGLSDRVASLEATVESLHTAQVGAVDVLERLLILLEAIEDAAPSLQRVLEERRSE